MEDEFNLTMKMLTGTDPNFDTETKEEFLDWLQKRKEKSMAVNKITHEDVTNFIKLLVEIGDVFVIDKDEYFVRNKTNEKLIKLKEGEKEFPIKIYHNNRIPGDYFILNLFKEGSIPNEAQRWYFNVVDEIVSMYMRLIFNGLINIFENNETDKIIALNKIIEFDEKLKPEKSMKEEIKKLDFSDILTIFYDKNTKSGEIQSNLNEEETKKKYKGTRKKTWDFIDGVFNSIFNGYPNEIHKKFEYQSTTIGAPHCEAIITLMFRYFYTIQNICNVLEINVPNMDEYEEHLRYIEKYQKMVLWDDGLRSKPLKEVAVPWQTSNQVQPNVQSPIPQEQSYPWGAPKSGVPDVVITNQGIRGMGNNVPQYQQGYGSYNQVNTGVPSYGVSNVPSGYPVRPNFVF